MAMVITDNSPSAGYVAWSGVVMTFKSVDYNVANGNSNKKYLWWDFTNPNALQESDTLPTLEDDDCVFLLNVDGLHYLVPGATIYRPELFSSADGWMATGEAWAYSSVDDPTGIITVPSGALLKYSVGMRIKFVNGGNTIYGIITAVTDTSITFLHEIDPTDSEALYLMENSAITLPYYSTNKAPFGFPLDSSKWTIEVKDVTERSQASPVADTWYNLGAVLITIPIGVWKVNYQVGLEDYVSSGGAGIYSTLSTANNSESDIDFTIYVGNYDYVARTNFVYIRGTVFREKMLPITVKTPYYLNTKRGSIGTSGTIKNLNDVSTCIIRAICSYL